MDKLRYQGWNRYDSYMTIGLFMMVIYYSGIYHQITKPVPYDNVHIEKVIYHEDTSRLEVFSSFVKRTCKFIKLSVQLESLSGLKYAEGWESDERGDRLEGPHVMRFSVIIDPSTDDTLVVRTRHKCKGRYVDKLFSKIIIRDWVTEGIR